MSEDMNADDGTTVMNTLIRRAARSRQDLILFDPGSAPDPHRAFGTAPPSQRGLSDFGGGVRGSSLAAPKAPSMDDVIRAAGDRQKALRHGW